MDFLQPGPPKMLSFVPRFRLVARRVGPALLLTALLTSTQACHDGVTHPAGPTPSNRIARSAASAGPCTAQYPTQPAGSRYGINVNQLSQGWQDPTSVNTYHTIGTLLRQANVGWLRVDFDRGLFDNVPNVATQGNWSRAKETVRQSTCRGFQIVGNLSYSAPVDVARPVGIPGARHTYLPDDMAKWSAYVRAVVDSFPEVRYWSIWNEPNAFKYFRGYGSETSTADLVPAYKALVEHAAPHIRGNYDGQGRRYLVAPELAGGLNDGSDAWLRGVLTAQGHNIDVVAVHAYGEADAITDYVRGLPTRLALPNWPWRVWLTETGPTGCNAGQDNEFRDRTWYCVTRGTPNKIYIDDTYQANHLAGLLSGMTGTSPAQRWEKTFYWHSHAENGAVGEGDDYGLLRGARTNALVGRPAFTIYAGTAGPLVTTGPASSGAGRVVVSAVPAVSGNYYYVWEYRWCTNSAAPGSCTYDWYYYAEGSGMTSAGPYMYADDYWLDLRVRQYAWSGGPQLGSASRRVLGPCGVPRARCTPAAGMSGSSDASVASTPLVDPAPTGRASPADTTAAVPHPVRIPAGVNSRNAERMKGRRGQRNL